MSALYFIVIIFQTIYVALIAAFGILFIGKVGLRDKIILRGPKLISKLFECDYCLSFWSSVILAIILALFSNEPIYFIIPILSTPITRLLI